MSPLAAETATVNWGYYPYRATIYLAAVADSPIPKGRSWTIRNPVWHEARTQTVIVAAGERKLAFSVTPAPNWKQQYPAGGGCAKVRAELKPGRAYRPNARVNEDGAIVEVWLEDEMSNERVSPSVQAASDFWCVYRDEPSPSQTPQTVLYLGMFNGLGVMPPGILGFPKDKLRWLNDNESATQLIVNLGDVTAHGEQSYVTDVRIACNTGALSFASWLTMTGTNGTGSQVRTNVIAPPLVVDAKSISESLRPEMCGINR